MPAIRVSPPSHAITQIETLAATGFSKRGIAAHFGVAYGTLTKWFEENPRFEKAFNSGREQERAALHNALYVQAIEKGNASAAMFLLKARHGYREGDQREESNRVAITFNLPGAMTAEQYALAKAAKAKVIDGNADDATEQLSGATAIATRRV